MNGLIAEPGLRSIAQVCGDIHDPEQRIMAAINFIETHVQENAIKTETQRSSNALLVDRSVSQNKAMKMTVCVRKDIGMTPGKMASQVAHACLQLATNLNSDRNRLLVREWQENSSEKIVVLECHSLDEMKSILSKAEQLGISTAPVADAGHTEVEPGTVTCIAVGPGDENIIDQITGQLKLYS